MGKQNKQGQPQQKKRQRRMTEEEKKKRFGPDYDPNFNSRKPANDSTTGAPDRNAPQFYYINETVGKQMANLPFNTLPGLEYSIEVTESRVRAQAISWIADTSVVGGMAIDYIPYFGLNNNKASGLNIAAQQLFSYVRHANSGARNYQAADLMMYVLALTDVYASYFSIRRMLSAAKTFDIENRYIPGLLGRMLCFNVDDAQANFANYAARLNILAAKINSLASPKYFTLTLRRAFIEDKIFADSTSNRGQFYAFRKSGYHMWSATTSDQGTELIYKEYLTTRTGTMWTIDQYLDTLEEQLQAMLDDDDAALMSGDILKAFSRENLYYIPSDEGSFILDIVFDEDVLAQIENSVALGTYMALPEISLEPDIDKRNKWFNVTQSVDANMILSGLHLSDADVPSDVDTGSTTLRCLKQLWFNSHKDEPTWENCLEWSRCMAVAVNMRVPTSGGGVASLDVQAGLELVQNYYVEAAGQSADIQTNFQTTAQAGTQTGILALSLLSQMDWHPIIYIKSPNGDITPMADLKVSTLVSGEVIARIHTMANESVLWNENLYMRADKTR
nr:putative capsid [Marmot picobirnavirus]